MAHSLLKTITSIIALIMVGFLTPVVATTLPAGVTQGPSLEGTTEYRLENGLRILLSPDSSKPSTTVNMTYLVGSRHENYGETGMAHLLEHMVFRGTPSMPNALAEFSKRGLQANGSTSVDRTNYYATFAANPETLDWYIRWQADVMQNATISRSELDSEMTVVRNEMERGENNPFRVLLQKMQAAAFQWHNYGKDTIGARSDVEQVDIDQLKAFYKLYYQPDNAVLLVSGDFDPDSTLKTIVDAFSSIAKPQRKLPPEYTVEPVQDGERQVSIKRQGGTPLVAALFHIPAAASPDYVPLDLATTMLSDTPSGRLYQQLVEDDKAASVFGFARSARYPSYAFFGAQLEPSMDAQEALAALDKALASISTNPFEEAQLNRIKNQYLNHWEQTYSDPASLTSALSEAVAAGDWRLFFLERDRVEKTTLEDVQKAAEAYFVASNRTNGIYLPTEKPERAPATTEVDFDSLFLNYQGRDVAALAESFDPTPAEIDKTTQLETLELANGTLQLALLPKPTRGNRVEARLLVQFADAKQLGPYRVAATVAGSLLDRGTPNLSRQEIKDTFDALQAQVSFTGKAGNVSVAINTTSEHLPKVVETVVTLIREANFPEKEVKEYQRSAVASIKTSMAEPTALAVRELARHGSPWPRDDIRYVPTFEESLDDIQALTRDELSQFHEKFYGAGTIRFAAAGSFDAAQVQEALTTALDGWKKAPSYQRISNPYHFVEPETFIIDTPDKANAFYLASQPLDIQDTNPDYASLVLANYLLGSSETSRLWNRVRVNEGLSYDVRSQFEASAYEPSGSWKIYAIHAPENTEKLKTVIQEELDKVLDQGFSEEEVKEGIQALLQYRRLARSRDTALAATWLSYLQLNRNFEWSQKLDDELAALDAKQVNNALRKWLKPDLFSVAIGADTSKQEAR